MTQGDSLSLTLFNMVVDAVTHHWVTVVAPIKTGMEGLGLSIRDLAAYFYVKNGLVASTQTKRLQREFNVLTGLFDWVGLRTNTRKAVSMACQPCHTPVRISGEAYKR